jgi:uncharacterized membrane protein YgaE (UPF0421/DUF939 family)
MALGVTTGIVVGEVALLLQGVDWAVLVCAVTFLAMMVAISFGSAPVMPIQAGVSALLVLILGPATAGTARLLDVGVGTAVGLIFSQVLLTPNPVGLVEDAARRVLEAVADGLRQGIEALRRGDPQRAQQALTTLSAAHDKVVALDAAIASARSSAKWSLRGRLHACEVNETIARYDGRALRLYASTLQFSQSLATAAGDADTARRSIALGVERLRAVDELLAVPAGGLNAASPAGRCDGKARGRPSPARRAASRPAPARAGSEASGT